MMVRIPHSEFADWWRGGPQFAAQRAVVHRVYEYFLVLLLSCGVVMAGGILVSPDGPRTAVGVVALAFAIVLAVGWIGWMLTDRRTTDRVSLVVFAALDLSTFVAFSHFESRTLQLLGVFIYCPLAFLIGFRHGARVLVAHCLFAAVAIGWLLTGYMLSRNGSVTGLVIGLALLIATVSMPISCHVFLDMFLKGTLDAQFDPLTGVYNRRGLIDRWMKITESYRIGDAVAVISVDLDEFKGINDRHGHRVGDAVLVHVAARLREIDRDAVGADLLAARVGGDEFVVVVGYRRVLAPEVRAAALAETIRVAISDNPPVPVTASIGVAVAYKEHPYPCTVETVSMLLHAADEGVYRAKQAGRDVVCGADDAGSE